MVANFMSNSIYIGLSVSFCRSGIKKSCHIISHFDVDSSVYDTSWFFAIKLINLRCLFSGFRVGALNGVAVAADGFVWECGFAFVCGFTYV